MKSIKKEGWVNVYSYKEGEGNYITQVVCDTKEEALNM